MTPKQLNQMLAHRVDEVVKLLLPGGKFQAGEWRVGSVSGESGDSMGVPMKGDKIGMFYDFATGEGGDLIDLWSQVKGTALPETLEQVRGFLGVQAPEWHRPKKSYTQPKKPKCQRPGGDAFKWLTETRKLSEGAIQDFQIAVDGDKIIFPFKRGPEKDSPMPMCKWRSIKSKDTMPTSAGQMPVLFGWQAMPKNARECVICEGEFDAMALHSFGYHGLSVPFGGGKGEKQAWIENEFEHLERFDVIYVCMDADKVGREAAMEIVERLGRERCKMVNLPAKDANDCLIEGVPPEMVHKAFINARYLDPAELKSGADYEDEIIWGLYPDEAPEGAKEIELPWQHKRDELAFRMSELALMAGINGHGKTAAAMYLTLNAMKQGELACVASMEMPPKRLMPNLTKQATGQRQPTKQYISTVVNWYRDRLWLFDCVGTAKAEKILEVFTYARKRYGVRWFVIDSLMKCGIAEDDYNKQKWFLEALADFKNEHDCFVLLLVHMRKGEAETKPGDKMDIKGTGAITDLPDTVLIHWRNKLKERAIEEPDSDMKEEDRDGILQMPDAIMRCVKQRNHPDGKEPKINLWFDRENTQFHAGPDAKPFQFVAHQGTPEAI